MSRAIQACATGIACSRIDLKQRIPYRPHQVRNVEEVARVGSHYSVDRLGEARSEEHHAEQQGAGHNSPFHPRRERHRQQRQNCDPDQRRKDQTARNPKIRPGPTRPCKASLHGKQNQSRHPGDLRKQNCQHRRLAQHVLGSRKRTAEIQRQRPIGKIGRDQSRPGEGRQQKRKHSLHTHEIEEELVVDREHARRYAQLLQESSRCGPGRSGAGTPAGRRSTPQTTQSETSSETSSVGNSGREPGTATTPESALPAYGL